MTNKNQTFFALPSSLPSAPQSKMLLVLISLWRFSRRYRQPHKHRFIENYKAVPSIIKAVLCRKIRNCVGPFFVLCV